MPQPLSAEPGPVHGFVPPLLSTPATAGIGSNSNRLTDWSEAFCRVYDQLDLGIGGNGQGWLPCGLPEGLPQRLSAERHALQFKCRLESRLNRRFGLYAHLDMKSRDPADRVPAERMPEPAPDANQPPPKENVERLGIAGKRCGLRLRPINRRPAGPIVPPAVSFPHHGNLAAGSIPLGKR